MKTLAKNGAVHERQHPIIWKWRQTSDLDFEFRNDSYPGLRAQHLCRKIQEIRVPVMGGRQQDRPWNVNCGA